MAFAFGRHHARHGGFGGAVAADRVEFHFGASGAALYRAVRHRLGRRHGGAVGDHRPAHALFRRNFERQPQRASGHHRQRHHGARQLHGL